MATTGPPELLRLQEQHKSMLAQLAAYCDARGLEWFLVAGSALGAVRHGDVIPWDDDVDVGLMRGAYDRLCAALARDPIPGMFLQTWDSQPGYWLPFAKLRLDGSYFGDNLFEHTGFHCGIFIDLFPFDRLPKSRIAVVLQRELLRVLDLLLLPASPATSSGARYAPRRLIKGGALAASKLFPLRLVIRLREFVTRLDFLPKGAWADCFGMFGASYHQLTRVPLAELVPPSTTRFGTLTVCVPADPDAYLRRLYGDYRQLPSEDKRQPTHVVEVRFPETPATDP